MTQPITLGELIKQLSHCNPDARIQFDFGDLHPTVLRSYRGFYDQLALDWDRVAISEWTNPRRCGCRDMGAPVGQRLRA
jgi:hypothetical protein